MYKSNDVNGKIFYFDDTYNEKTISELKFKPNKVSYHDGKLFVATFENSSM